MEARRKRNIPKSLLLCLLFSGILVMCLEMGLSMLRPEAPGSPARHGALWAACFGLLAAGTLLAACWQPAAKAWQWAEDRIMNPETRKPWIDIALAVAAGAMLLHHFYVLLYYPVLPAGATRLAPVWIVLAAATAVLGRSWRDWGTRIGTLLLVYMFERLYLNNMAVTGKETVWFASGIYAVFICFGVFPALRSSVRKGFLTALCSLWSAGTLAVCGAGIYSAWTGTTIPNPAGGLIQVFAGRLNLFSNPAISGGLAGSCAAVALIGFAAVRQKWAKAGFLIAAFAAILAVSLTDARSSFMMIGFLAAGMLSLSAWGKWRSGTDGVSRAKRLGAAALLVLGFLLCFFLAVEGERLLTSAFLKVRDQGGLTVSGAYAEEEIPEEAAEEAEEASVLPPEFRQRNVWLPETTDTDPMLNGRVTIWRQAFEYIRTHPGILMSGLSVNGLAAGVLGRHDHLHNILMQLLMEGGIPALLLYLGLLLYFFIHACRLWRRPELPLWQRALPVPALAILLQEMAECLTHFAYGHPPMTVLWFFMGCTVAVSRQALAEEAGKTAGASLTRGTTGG